LLPFSSLFTAFLTVAYKHQPACPSTIPPSTNSPTFINPSDRHLHTMFLTEDALSDDSSFEDYISVSPPTTMESNTQAQQISIQQAAQSSPEQLVHSGNVNNVNQSDPQAFGGQLVEFRSSALGNASPDVIPLENVMTLPEASSQG
jgi:hypothetical protein